MAEEQFRQPHISFRIHLLWTHSCPTVFHRVSANVIREVCSYFAFLPDVLVHVQRGSIWSFAVYEKTWTPFQVTKRKLTNVVAAVFIGTKKAFMVISNITSAIEDPPYYTIHDHGMTTRYGDFERDRYISAVTYDPTRNCVYILGGRSLFGTQTKAVCKFSLLSCEGEALPDMLVGRSGFGLCWHRDLLYICAGSDPSVHTFHPSTQIHAALSSLLLSPEDGNYGFLAVYYADQIVILSQRSVWKGQGQQWSREQRREEESEKSLGNPVLLGKFLYYSHQEGCSEFNLDTGEVCRYSFNTREAIR